MRFWSLGLALLLCFLLQTGWATTAFPEKVNCPVCQTGFSVARMMSTNNAGGVDRDFLQHAGGSQPLVLQIACCPKCHYSNYVDGFVEKNKVPDPIKAFVLSPDYKVPSFQLKGRGGDEEGFSQRNVPAWVAYDLRAQICRKKDKTTPLELANLYLKAAWATRFEENPFDDACASVDEKTLESLSKVMPEPKESDKQDRSQLRIDMARQLIGQLGTLAPPQDRAAAVWAAYTLRRHGENDLIAANWPLLKAHWGEGPDLSQTIATSADLEKHYLALALESLQQHLQGSPEPKVHLVYLCGELQRRLGHPAEAVPLFEKALQLKPGEDLKNWIQAQQALCK
jgi:hypothetical protein